MHNCYGRSTDCAWYTVPLNFHDSHRLWSPVFRGLEELANLVVGHAREQKLCRFSLLFDHHLHEIFAPCSFLNRGPEDGAEEQDVEHADRQESGAVSERANERGRDLSGFLNRTGIHCSMIVVLMYDVQLPITPCRLASRNSWNASNRPPLPSLSACAIGRIGLKQSSATLSLFLVASSITALISSSAQSLNFSLKLSREMLPSVERHGPRFWAAGAVDCTALVALCRA